MDVAVLAAGGLAIGVLVFIVASRAYRSPVNRLGKVVYRDDMHGSPVLRSQEHRLAGKPDFVVASRGIGPFSEFRPVELKTSEVPRSPYPAHVMQLAAQGLLVEAEFGRFPRHGYLHYKPQSGAPEAIVRVRLGPRVRRMAVELARRIHRGDCHPKAVAVGSHCRGCHVRDVCPILAAAGGSRP